MKNKPGAAVDGYWIVDDGKPAAFTRYVAGGPLNANVPWASFDPAPENLVVDRRQHKTSN